MWIRRIVRTGLIAVGAAASAPALASAAPVTIGDLAPANPPAVCAQGPAEFRQSGVSDPATTYTVPAGYTTITSWSTSAASGAGQTLKFKVFRAAGSNDLVVAHDGPRSLNPSAVNSFPVHIPVQPGDRIGLNTQNASTHHNACLFGTASTSDIYGEAGGDGDDGTTEGFGGSINTEKARVNVAATLAAPAAVTRLDPQSGPAETVVVVRGHDFTGTTAVAFGGTPAASFKVLSDGAIRAVAPPRRGTGTADIIVTTPAGQSTPTIADQFGYTINCIVPRLKGKTLGRARTLLAASHCQLGIVARPAHAKGKKLIVKSQVPAAGAVLADGAGVSVKLRPKPHHR